MASCTRSPDSVTLTSDTRRTPPRRSRPGKWSAALVGALATQRRREYPDVAA
jgi:hypothetical protein